MTIYDIGGGANPSVSLRAKTGLGLRVVGLDISAEALERAPEGSYDEKIQADICAFAGRGDGDLALCLTVLEHVGNVAEAFRGIASVLRPGGIALVFAPCRNALFARLNMLTPRVISRWALGATHHESGGRRGFPAIYDRCTPRSFKALAHLNGFQVETTTSYFYSPYYRVFFPLHLTWRAFSTSLHMILGEDAAESFGMLLSRSV
jgi:SAM-dependent methyltransferase